MIGKVFRVVHDPGADYADADRPAGGERGDIVEVVKDRRLRQRRTEPQRHGLVHRPVIQDGDVDLLAALLRLQLGQVVGRVAGDVFDRHAVFLLERGKHLLAHDVLERSAIGGHVEGLGLGVGAPGEHGAGKRGRGEQRHREDGWLSHCVSPRCGRPRPGALV